MAEFEIINEEKAQSKARVVICWISLAGFLVMARTKGLHGSDLMNKGLATILAYLAFATVWFEFIKQMPKRHPWRRNISLIADLAIMTAWFHLGGGEVATYYPIFLWVIIGNGIRYGEVFLLRGIVLGGVGFGSVLYFNPYWRSHLDVGLGLMLGVLVLPIFYQGALRRLRKMNDLKMELAKSRLAEKAKDRFLASMSHEIRTPMNGVLGMADSLSRTDLDPDQREQLQVITSSVESLLRTIGDILDYAGMTAEKLTLQNQEFDLHQILQDVVRLMRTSAEERNIDLQFEYDSATPHNFVGDPARIRQVAFHLLSNGIKFTEEGSVKISCKMKKDRVAVSVSDTGIGIPAQRLETIFRCFEQADNSTTRRYEGMGLGLGLIQQLTSLMQGQLTVKSKEGRGSTFTVTLPLEIVAKAPVIRTESKPEQAPSMNLRALVVEDNKFNQVVISRLLSMMGIESVLAENGLEAVEAVERETFDVVYMDIRMPVMDGIEATIKLRAREGGSSRLPIIAVTADATRQVQARCREVGMDAFLAKPLTLNSLTTVTENAMQAVDQRDPVLA
ncbi:hypothetical protein CO151_09700 [bacterium CG_4_9_14_3_um_filter_65_15]|nr:MAG: hypothetical protein CO151_09700 [bacterium CG_4_9_14_3_um_filter_65_15]